MEISLAFACLSTTVFSFNNAVVLDGVIPKRLYATSSRDGNDYDKQNDGAEIGGETPIAPAVVTAGDDHSDLTDRFKYKVHALMGSFDPPPGAVDDENQTGNIIGAMLQFPTTYTFTVVGKNEIDDTKTEREASSGDNYTNEVKKVLESILGSNAKMEMRVVPRGKKFTRVSVKVDVESAALIASIYDELDALEATVMKF